VFVDSLVLVVSSVFIAINIVSLCLYICRLDTLLRGTRVRSSSYLCIGSRPASSQRHSYEGILVRSIVYLPCSCTHASIIQFVLITRSMKVQIMNIMLIRYAIL
jgi:hypothetical protein